MSAKSDLDDLMKVINSKFRDQRRVFQQEKQELLAKLDSFEKRLKERDGDNATLREQLLAVKQRNLELEKLIVDQNSLIQRMRSKLQVSFDNSFNGSTAEAGGGGGVRKPLLEDKCVSTDDWLTILENELAERIERFAAMMHAKESETSRTNGRLSVSGLDTSNRSLGGQSRNGNASVANHSRLTNREYDSEYATSRPPSKNLAPYRHDRSGLSFMGSDNLGHPPLSVVARGTSTPATSIWQASTPLSNRHSSHNGEREISNQQRSLPLDDTLRDAPTNYDASALEADLMQRFSELEMEAQALFGLDDPDEAETGAPSGNSSVVHDL